MILLYFAFTAAHHLALSLRSAETLTLCGDKFTTPKCHPVSINWLFLQRDLKQLLTRFQIEHTDTGSSLLAKLALKFKMLRSPLKMCELISLSMVFFLSFEYGELGSIIHYSWISLCGKSSISKQHSTKFTAQQGNVWKCHLNSSFLLGFMFIVF